MNGGIPCKRKRSCLTGHGHPDRIRHFTHVTLRNAEDFVLGYLLSMAAVVLWGLVQIPIKIAKAPGRVGVMVSMPAGIVAVVTILLFQGNLVLPESSLCVHL